MCCSGVSLREGGEERRGGVWPGEFVGNEVTDGCGLRCLQRNPVVFLPKELGSTPRLKQTSLKETELNGMNSPGGVPSPFRLVLLKQASLTQPLY